MRAELKLLGDSVIMAVRSYVAKAHDGLAERIDGLECQIKAIPAGAKGDKGDPGESIQGPKGDRGEAGKDFDPSAIEELREVGRRLDALEKRQAEAVDKEFSERVSKALGEQVLVVAK